MMTEEYYIRKRQEYMSSGAEPAIKEEAIRKLDEQYNEKKAYLIAKEDLADGQSELRPGELD